MPATLHALDYLKAPDRHPVGGVCVVFGDEPFLKGEVLARLRERVLGPQDGEFSLNVFAGSDAEWRDVHDLLATASLFGADRRMVLVEEADDFVSRHRGPLEDYVARPLGSGVLVLEVKKWASNTRLYQAVAQSDLQIECKRPTPARLKKWLVARAKAQHGVPLEPAAAELLLDMSEPDVGLLDQQLARLASLAGPQAAITSQLVHDHVGSWRTRKTWDMIDAATAGDARDALVQLDRLLLAGENPIGLLAQMAGTLRRLAVATQWVDQADREGRRIALRPALEQAGFKPFVLGKAEAQLRQLGRQRGRQLGGWLLDADLAMKGASSSPPRARLVLERLIVRMSKAADPRKQAATS